MVCQMQLAPLAVSAPRVKVLMVKCAQMLPCGRAHTSIVNTRSVLLLVTQAWYVAEGGGQLMGDRDSHRHQKMLQL